MSLRVAYKADYFLSSWVTISFLTSTVLHGTNLELVPIVYDWEYTEKLRTVHKMLIRADSLQLRLFQLTIRNAIKLTCGIDKAM